MENQYEKYLNIFEKINEKLKEQEKHLNNIDEYFYKNATSLGQLEIIQESLNRKTAEFEEMSVKYADDLNKRDENLQKLNQLEEKRNELLKEQKNLINKIHSAKGKQLTILQKLYEENAEKIEENEDNLKLVKDSLEHCVELGKLRNEISEESIKLEKELHKRIVEGTTALDDQKEKWELRTRAVRKGFKEIKEGFTQSYKALIDTLEPWSKAEDEAFKYARAVGMSEKATNRFLSNTVSWAAKNNIGILFNKSTDELIKMQSKYSEVLGRNVQLTGEQKLDMLAMEKFLGEDGMADIANNLENFGLGMSDSADFIHKTMNEATKSGIVASKLTKVIRENIKMAQNYTFKNGLEGLTSMAKKAIQLKTDMSFINGFADKVSTVEGAITTGANLQVLGGSYAMGSDPLSMMYESLNDFEGLFDRAVGMAKGKVFYNNKTKNFEMGAMDRYLMKQAATQMGIDPSKMIDAAFRQASLGRIESAAKENSTISNDPDLMDLVKNLATWDNGEAVIDLNGKKTRVQDIKESDKQDLIAMQRTDSQNLQDLAVNLRSVKDILSGESKEINNEQADMVSVMGKGFKDLLKQTELLNLFAQGGAMFNIASGGLAFLGGLLTAVRGIWRTMIGTRNVFGGFGGRGAAGRGMIGGRGASRMMSRGAIKTLGGGTFGRGAARMLSTTGGRMLGSAAGGGLIGAGISLGSDLITGDFQKDPESSLQDAAGAGIGGAIGGAIGSLIFPGGGTLIGGMIGSWLGGVVTNAVQDSQKKNRENVRREIADKLGRENSKIAGLFYGDNALKGNYSESQLRELEKALSDGKISKKELSSSLERKARANGDLRHIYNSGHEVYVELGSGGIIGSNGGILKGKSHAEGGMPILGSNIAVEGGEYVVNKKATSENLPLLERINTGNYSMTAKEPLGKQLKVNKHGSSDGYSMPHNSNIKMEPVSINLSGTIKLDAGNRQFDITNDIINNPQIISKLTEMINKQINILDFGAYNKGSFKQKFV
jgi:hypothetical protein